MTRRTSLLAVLAVLVVAGTGAAPAAAASGSVTGVVFEDADRDGVRGAAEAGWAAAPVHLLDGAGRQVAATVTDSAGTYRFDAVPAGSYSVSYDGRAWRDLRETWVPTTTGSLRPQRAVEVGGAAQADLGLRRIVRSAPGSPISRVVGADGLVVESYDDVVPASEVHAALLAGLRGREAGATTVRFDVGRTNVTTSSWGGSRGTYSGFSAVVQSTWLSWLEQGDASLVHEYGHAWSLFHAVVVQQDETLAAYLEARGLTGDPRLGSSATWSPEEMVAEDYRQLLGSPTARLRPQANTELPAAKDVPGLEEFLRTTFTGAPAAAPALAPSASPSSAPVAVSSVAMNPVDVTKAGTASYVLSAPARATVEVLDGAGTVVRLLTSGDTAAGPASLPWDRRDGAGNRVRAGGYVLRVTAVAGGATARGTAAFRVR